MSGKLKLLNFAGMSLGLLILLNPCCFVQAEETESVLKEIRGKTMGTTYSVKLRLRDEPESGKLSTDSRLEKAKQEIDQRLVEINQSMSTYLPDSEISRFNRSTSLDLFAVGNDFQVVTNRSLELSKMTDGRFDPTVGPLVRYWGFGGGTAPEKLPTKSDVQNVLAGIGFEHLSLSDNGVVKSKPEIQVDYSAIAKGYAVDQVSEIVKRYADDFMVEIGGEVRASGSSPKSNEAWRIGIELPGSDPLAVSRNLAARVQLDGKSLATSGDYRNFVVIEGQKFQHTIDPRTGFPVDQGILSVSVLSDDCMTADGLATALMVYSLEEIQEFSNDQKLGTFVIYRDADEKIQFWKSDGFPGEIVAQDSKPVSEQSDPQSAQQDNPMMLIVGTIVVFGLAISGMAIGVIISNRQLKGSCGGLSAMSQNGSTDASPCSLCTKPASECSKRAGQESTETEVAQDVS